MKEHIEKHRKKYTIAVFIVIAAVLVLIIVYGFSWLSGADKPKGKVDINLDSKTIKSGESTQLSVGAKNTGKVPIRGVFSATVDDPTSVTISYPEPELLKFDLLPGESIQRMMNVTGTSKAYKTYYKIIVKISSDNTTYAQDNVILVVTDEK
jgi:uncharacterized membrane protein